MDGPGVAARPLVLLGLRDFDRAGELGLERPALRLLLRAWLLLLGLDADRLLAGLFDVASRAPLLLLWLLLAGLAEPFREPCDLERDLLLA